MLQFVPPSVVRRIPISGALVGEYTFGLAVLRIAGEWVETEFPSAEQVAAADLYFEGGHLHAVDEATAIALAVAGYDVDIPPGLAAVVGLAVVGVAIIGFDVTIPPGSGAAVDSAVVDAATVG